VKEITLVGEDALCCALGERLIFAGLPGWRVDMFNTKGVTKLASAMPRYLNLAKHVMPVLCVADTDGKCVLALRKKWLAKSSADRLLLRFAVTEAESWVMADRLGFAEALAVPANKVPRHPDDEIDPKRSLLSLANESKKRLIRDELVSLTDRARPGSGYNLHLCNFIRTRWDPLRASQHSPSLARALRSLETLRAEG
jgi:hypothetical protein